MDKRTDTSNLEKFKDCELTKKQAEEVKGEWLFLFISNPFRSTINMICYGNVNGIQNRRW